MDGLVITCRGCGGTGTWLVQVFGQLMAYGPRWACAACIDQVGRELLAEAMERQKSPAPPPWPVMTLGWAGKVSEL
jgi:hypothetical protein